MPANKKRKINKIETTGDNLTGRGGLSFFVRYLTSVGIFSLLTGHFGDIRKNRKGLPAAELFKQIFCWLTDGTSRHISFFDHLRRDEGYAGGIETPPEDMASSHIVKRFFKSFSIFRMRTFRDILFTLLLWRLRIKQPKAVFIDIDTMVMDNDEAEVRHGVGPTYKKKKGFQPLQVTWNRYIIDAVFRGGIRHSNYSDTVVKTVRRLTESIRRDYRSDVIIVLTCDAGFFDQKNFQEFEQLGIYYISGARLTKDVRETVCLLPHEEYGRLKKEDQTWEYTEFGFKYDSWDKFRRFVFCRPMYEKGQMLLNFERAETLLVTNITTGTVATDMPDSVRDLLNPENLITAYHSRGANELIHRGFKDFGFEQMPFKRFPPNAALYYMMLIAFFLFETFKEDILHPVIPLQSYAATVRRGFIDIAAKVTFHSDQIIVRFGREVFRRLGLDKLWDACSSPPCPI